MRFTKKLAAFAASLLAFTALAPIAHAAENDNPYADVHIEKLADGTGHGTPAQTFINKDNGYSPGDNTPTDGVVSSGDIVTYKVTVNVKAGPERPVKAQFEIPEFLEYDAALNSDIPPINLLKKSPTVSASKNAVSYSMIAMRGVAVSFETVLTLKAKDTAGEIKENQIVKAAIHRGSMKAYAGENAKAVTVVSAPQADLIVDVKSHADNPRNANSTFSSSTETADFAIKPVAISSGDYTSSKGASTLTPWSADVNVSELPEGVTFAVDGSPVTADNGVISLSDKTGTVVLSVKRGADHWGLEEGQTQAWRIGLNVKPGSFATDAFKNNGIDAQPGDNMQSGESTAGWNDTNATEGWLARNNDYTYLKIARPVPSAGVIFGKSMRRPWENGYTIFDEQMRKFSSNDDQGTSVTPHGYSNHVAEDTEYRVKLHVYSQNIKAPQEHTVISDQWNADQVHPTGKITVKNPAGDIMKDGFKYQWYVGSDGPKTRQLDNGAVDTIGMTGDVTDISLTNGWVESLYPPEGAKAIRVIFTNLPSGTQDGAGEYTVDIPFSVTDTYPWDVLPAVFPDRMYGSFGEKSETFVERTLVPTRKTIPVGGIDVQAKPSTGAIIKHESGAEFRISSHVSKLASLSESVNARVTVNLDPKIINVEGVETGKELSGWKIDSATFGDGHDTPGTLVLSRAWAPKNYDSYKDISRMPDIRLITEVSRLAVGDISVSATLELVGLEGRTYTDSDFVTTHAVGILGANIIANTPKVETADNLDWTVNIAAQSSNGSLNTETETVVTLPQNGKSFIDGDLNEYDGARESSYNGSYKVKSATIDEKQSSEGTTILFTRDAKPSIDGNWSAEFTENVTGFKVVQSADGSGLATIHYTLVPENNKPDDVYVSYISPVTSKTGLKSDQSWPVQETVVASQITGYVYWDKSLTGADRDEDSMGIPGVELDLIRESDQKVLETATTDDTGFYSFTRDKHSDQYSVKIKAGVPETVASKFIDNTDRAVKQTFSYRYKRADAAKPVSDTVYLGIDHVFKNVNFGFFAEDPYIGLDKTATQPVVNDDGTVTMNWQIDIENRGNTTQSGIQLHDLLPKNAFNVQAHYGTLDKTVRAEIKQVSAGPEQSFAVTTDGKVYAWGNNADGALGLGVGDARNTPTEIPGLSNVASVSAASNHSFAVTTDGKVYAWGYNDYGQLGLGFNENRDTPTEIPGLSNVASVSAGPEQSFAVTTGGKVYGWGGGALGLGDGRDHNTPIEIPGLSNVTSVSTDYSHSLAVTNDGKVYAWGTNTHGQLGLGDGRDHNTPIEIPGLSNVTSVSTGGVSSLAVTTGGKVYAWGNNDYGQLGLGDNRARNTPTEIPGLSNVASVSTGEYHTLAVTNDGKVYGWGYDADGALGLGVGDARNTPTEIPGLSNVASVSAASNHSFAVTTDGKVYAWGYNDYGQLGLGDKDERATPTEIVEHFVTVVPGEQGLNLTPKITNRGDAGYQYTFSLEDMEKALQTPDTVKQVSVGDYSHSLAVTNDGKVYAWGTNTHGQLGLSDKDKRDTPTEIPGLSNVVSVSAGPEQSFAVTTDGKVYAWGDGLYGRTGLGFNENRDTPTEIPGLSNVASVSTGEYHTLAVTNDGKVYGWGYDADGALGLGVGDVRNTPTEVPGLSNVASVSAASNHSFAVTTDGKVYAWGNNDYGQLGLGDKRARNTPTEIPGLSNVASVSTDYNRSFAVTTGGKVYGWGGGALGLGDGRDHNTPIEIPGLSNVTSVSTGGVSSLAVTTGGKVYAWGNNDYGQLGLGDKRARNTPTEIPSISVGAIVTVEPKPYHVVVTATVPQPNPTDDGLVLPNQAWVTSDQNNRAVPDAPTVGAFDHETPWLFGDLTGNHSVTVNPSGVMSRNDDQADQVFNQIPALNDVKTAPWGAVSGYAWLDANKNGERLDDDAPIAGVKVSLIQGDTTVRELVTDDTGFYEFNFVQPGDDYKVSFDFADGSTKTGKLPESFALTKSNSDSFIENGMAPLTNNVSKSFMVADGTTVEWVNAGVKLLAPSLSVDKSWNGFPTVAADKVMVQFDPEGHDGEYYVWSWKSGENGVATPLVKGANGKLNALIAATEDDKVNFSVFAGKVTDGQAQFLTTKGSLSTGNQGDELKTKDMNNVSMGQGVKVTYSDLATQKQFTDTDFATLPDLTVDHPDDGTPTGKTAKLPVTVTVTNTGDETLTGFNLVDETLDGSTMKDVESKLGDKLANETLNPSESLTVQLEWAATLVEHHRDTVTVTAEGVESGTSVTGNATFDGTTTAEGLPEPLITVEKGIKQGDSLVKPDTLVAVDTEIWFKVTNTGKDTLRNVLVTDESVNGEVTDIVPASDSDKAKIDQLAVNDSIWFKGKLTGLNADEAHKNTATAYGVGVRSQKPVSSKDTLEAQVTPQKQKFTLLKVDDDNEKLKGAKFELIHGDDVRVLDGDTDNWSLELTHGDYVLRETESPDTFAILPQAIKFTVDANGVTLHEDLAADKAAHLTDGSVLTVQNFKQGDLPHSGRIDLVGALGGALLAAVAGAYLLRRRENA